MYKYSVLLLGLLFCGLPATAQDADPTRPPVATTKQRAETAQAPELTLASIWYQQGNSRARINEESYRIGDTVEGYRITDIEANRVHLERDGRQLFLSVFGSQRIVNGEQNP
ncbi:Type II secretory pathway component [Aliidiomarina minuta]|uniref:Type II secretory pathway component n=1 Tax=Aliidiomarina minuta TaxID=880057 RepID=A0A432W959_9GAMM|nr:Type II secretory pathway component [Aliidiomarina minuta]RUO26687.1 Type II secretory pathway component [Aliidiomarina minuta]